MGARIYAVAFCSLLTGVCNMLMIKTLNDVIHGGVSAGRMAIFAGAVLGYLATSRFFSAALLRATQRAVYDMRVDILTRVAACDLQRFEQVPNQYVYTAVTEDTGQIARSPEILSSMLIAGFTILVCFGYLLWLSPTAFALLVVCTLLGGWLYSRVAGLAERDWQRARETQDAFFRLVDHQLRGFKELKMSDTKRRAFFEDDLLARCRDGYTRNVAGGEKYIQAVLVSGVLIYGILGAFAFSGQAWLGLAPAPFAATILVMLYLTPAIQQAVDLLPTLDRFGIAVDKIERLQRELAQQPSLTQSEPEPLTLPPYWRRIQLDAVTFHYPSTGGDSAFGVGPLDFSLTRGEVVFVVGGNGSGKTTLIKLLLGLYRPEAGRLLVDGTAYPAGEAAQRLLFAPLFADFHLFDRVYGNLPDCDEVTALLHLFQLEHKVSLDDGAWSTLALSQGQRKRLGLVGALLDPAPILVMDEFAADQDPDFRRTFYHDLLPLFRARGKTVVAITHDEAYFDRADRILHMVEGRLEPMPQTTIVSAALT